MSDSSKNLDHLIELMAKLPGLGPRSARRAVLHMVKKRALLMAPLADVLAEVAVTVRECLNCGNIGTADTCDICQNPKRENGEICVVEEVSDLWAMERSHMFKGRYHVLGSRLWRKWIVANTFAEPLKIALMRIRRCQLPVARLSHSRQLSP